MDSKHGAPFAAPVSEDLVPGYRTIIQRPMDLGTISQSLKDRSYRALGEALPPASAAALLAVISQMPSAA